MPFLHCVNGLYHLVRFLSGWYWLFLFMIRASFMSSHKISLVVTKSLTNCLFVKDFIFPSLMKLSLAEYEILGWKFFSLRMFNIGPYSLMACRVSVERYALSLMGFPLWVSPSELSLWLPLAFFSSFQPWCILQLCALGWLFLKNIFVVFSAFTGLECLPS